MIGAIGGAVLGGFLGKHHFGGTVSPLATAAGAVAGGVAGRGVQSAMNKTRGVELKFVKTMATPLSGCAETRNTRFGRSACRAVLQQRQAVPRLHAQQACVVTWPHRMPPHLNRESAIP